MIVFPNCKVNLGLHIIAKRGDGYHNLETVFYPIPYLDALEAIHAENFEFTSSGLQVQIEQGNNLCIQAVNLLEREFPQCAKLKLHLHKAIPVGAGLGGGSADAAFTLKLLNATFNLGLSNEKLLDYALQLGSDCPFFVINQPCFATGRGEFLQRIKLNLDQYSMLMVNPGISISTAWAFSQLTPSTPRESIQSIVQDSLETWKNRLTNDFEKPVFAKYPEIQSVKDAMYNAGAIYSSMTGSGSTVFGIFRKNQIPRLFAYKNYIIKEFAKINSVAS